MNPRLGRDSRCCQPTESEYVWLWEHDRSHPAVIDFEEWFDSLSNFERDNQWGIIDDLFEAAARGELIDPGDATTQIKPIRTNPDIYELRRKALSKALRFYHAEPEKLPDNLVGLHRHIKTGDSSQQDEIDHATKHYQNIGDSW